MLEWFVRVLTSAEVAGEKVQVIGHVPPGRSPDCMETWSKNYFRIIERFQHQISAQFFGHTHYDEIQILYDQFGSAISTAYIAPSLTSYIYMMPTYRVYDIDGYHKNTTWSVANHKTYRLDLEEANRVDTPNWILEYDACNAFDQFYLSTENWESLVSSWEKFIVDKNLTPVPKTLTSYAKFYMRHPYLPPPEGLYNQLHCHDRSCYQSLVCNIIKNKQSELCFPIKP
uniref:Uncharacterized protein n=1 Tax=Ciona savignyi TaxID=51511 RepID=H2YC47_CIOSA